MNPLIEKGLEIYEAARNGGKTKNGAIQVAYNTVPGLKDAVTVFPSSDASYWGSNIGKFERSFNSVHVSNGDGNGNGPLFPAESQNGYSATDDMVGYIEHRDPQVGEEVVLSLHYLAWYHKKYESAWRYSFNPDGPLAKRGWKFEIVKSNGKCFTLRVVARPQTEKQRMIEDIKREMAELNRKLEQLNTM